MNHLHATITKLESSQGVSLVHFDLGGHALSMIALELSPSLEVGTAVILGIKATKLALCKAVPTAMSITNHLPLQVESVTMGTLLCRVMLRFEGTALESVFTRAAAEAMALEVGEEVIALIQPSELSIVELL